MAADRGKKAVIPKKWLDTEPLWKSRLGDGWVGKRMLGSCGQGMVGHWTYEGKDAARQTLTDIAVKQGLYTHGAGTNGFARRGFHDEVGFLLKFSDVETPHIVKMYKHLFEDVGNTNEKQDKIGTSVHRLYLEFCPGGDLNGMFKKHSRRRPVPEEELWALFHCLARGVTVMDRGTEDVGGPRKWQREDGEMCHLDLKLENILIGKSGVPDREHGNHAPYKIADFGLTQMCPPLQSKQFVARAGGTSVWKLPEQTSSNGIAPSNRPWNHKSKDARGRTIRTSDVKDIGLGAASNIWHIGMIMLLMAAQPNIGGEFWDDGSETFILHRSKLDSPFLKGKASPSVTTPRYADKERRRNKQYTDAFHILLNACLFVNPSDRIEPKVLVARTRFCWNLYMQSKGKDISGRNKYPSYKEPELSDRWYSGQKRQAKPPPPPAAKKPRPNTMYKAPPKPKQGPAPAYQAPAPAFRDSAPAIPAPGLRSRERRPYVAVADQLKLPDLAGLNLQPRIPRPYGAASIPLPASIPSTPAAVPPAAAGRPGLVPVQDPGTPRQPPITPLRRAGARAAAIPLPASIPSSPAAAGTWVPDPSGLLFPPATAAPPLIRIDPTNRTRPLVTPLPPFTRQDPAPPPPPILGRQINLAATNLKNNKYIRILFHFPRGEWKRTERS